MYQGLVLVDLRALSMTQTRMSRVRVRRTAAEAPRRQELLSPQKAMLRGHEFRRSNNLGRVDWSRPREGSGTSSRLTSLPGFGEISRFFFHVWVACAPWG